MDTITVGGTADLAVTIPYQLGYHPGQSLVVVGLTGSRVLGIMRLDLVEPDRPDVGAEALRTFARIGADGVLMVAFESRPSEGASLLRSFRAGASAHGLAVRDCVVVRGGQCFVVSATGHTRGRGRALPDASRVPAIAEFVARGRSPLADRQSLTALVECDGSALSRQVGSRVADLVGPTGLPGAALTDLDDPRITADSVRAWHLLLADRAGPVRADLLASALVGLRDRGWRDGLLAWLCPDTLPLDEVRAEVLADLAVIPRPAHGDREQVSAGAGAGAGERPTGDVGSQQVSGEGLVGSGVASGEGTARRLLSWCRLLPDDTDEVAAAALTVAAHVLWCDGDGTLASVALARALRVAPHYRLAVLLDQLVAAGVRACDAAPGRSGPDVGHAA